MKEWKSKVFEAAVLLLAVSLVAHLAWLWLAQLVPVLLALAVLLVIWRLLLGGRRR
jgi:hypothetical protein